MLYFLEEGGLGKAFGVEHVCWVSKESLDANKQRLNGAERKVVFIKKENDRKNSMIEGKLELHMECLFHLELEVYKGEGGK